MHTLICGMTGSGKTFWARELARRAKAKGTAVLVLDVARDPRWCADFVTDDPDAFVDLVFRSTCCALFVDEGAETIGRWAGPMRKLATISRRWGHNAIFITQRAADLDRSIRGQCEAAFIFKLSPYDAKLLEQDFGAQEIGGSSKFVRRECLFVRRFGECMHFEVPQLS